MTIPVPHYKDGFGSKKVEFIFYEVGGFVLKCPLAGGISRNGKPHALNLS
jgi:hypothetical protein